MNKENVATIIVVYLKNEIHKNMAIRALESFPETYTIAVVNDNTAGLDLDLYADHVIINDENCLASAWNKGVEYALNEGFEYTLMTNLDVMLKHNTLDYLIKTMEEQKEQGYNPGIVAANYTNSFQHFTKNDEETGLTLDVEHGDGSFSCYLLDIEAWVKVRWLSEDGHSHSGFNENFKPAYFEDDAFLEGLWEERYEPVVAVDAHYYHKPQGTVMNSKADLQAYPHYMQRNLELYKSIYGEAPPHLPKDIKFRE